MPGKSKIEWTDTIWNPVTGCTKVSAGCLNCYAEMMTRRFQWDGPFVPWTVKAQRASEEPPVYLHYDRLEIPSRWREPRRVFVNSMSDLFHPDVPDSFIAMVFQQMAGNPRHTFQVLTKRPERALEWFNHVEAFKPGWEHVVWLDHGVGVTGVSWPLPNVWMGVSVENAKALHRVGTLGEIPAAVRFVSCEPLLGPVDLSHVPLLPTLRSNMRRYLESRGEADIEGQLNAMYDSGPADPGDPPPYINALTGEWFDGWDSGTSEPLLNWAVAGGESGARARPMHPGYPRDIRDKCQAAGVPFFFKQWGEYCPVELSEPVTMAGPYFVFDDGACVQRVGRQAAGSLLDGVEHKEFPA